MIRNSEKRSGRRPRRHWETCAGIEDPDLLVEAQRDEMLVKKHNAAVEEMEILAADYNEAVRTYKARKD